MTDNGHWYVDLRVYKGHAGRALPTGIGLPIHSSKVPDVIAALRDALRRDGELDTGASGALWDGWTAAGSSASTGAGAGAGPTGVEGMWDEFGEWGAGR